MVSAALTVLDPPAGLALAASVVTKVQSLLNSRDSPVIYFFPGIFSHGTTSRGTLNSK